MFEQRKRSVVLRCCLAAVLIVTCFLATDRRAEAQYLVAPDGSFIVMPKDQPFQLGGTFPVGPVVVTGGNQWVRVGGTFSMTTPTMFGSPFAGFFKPVDSTARAKVSYLYGGKNPPLPPVIFPYQAWFP
jgi:hypothetical protein